MTLGMINLKSVVVDGKLHAAGSAMAHVIAIRQILEANGLWGKRLGSAIMDSCNVNVGDKGGVVAHLNRVRKEAGVQDSPIYIVHCDAHIRHNSLRTACEKGFGKDATKQRVGSNSTVIFTLESVSARGSAGRADLGLQGIPKPPLATLTRWQSLLPVARWTMAHGKQLAAGLTSLLERSGAKVGAHWRKLAALLSDSRVLVQISVLGAISRYCLDEELSYMLTDGGYIAYEQHQRLHDLCLKLLAAEKNPEAALPEVFEAAAATGFPHAEAIKLCKHFLHHYLVYLIRETSHLYSMPHIAAYRAGSVPS
jgi:hypothetical protein